MTIDQQAEAALRRLRHSIATSAGMHRMYHERLFVRIVMDTPGMAEEVLRVWNVAPFNAATKEETCSTPPSALHL